MSRLAALALAAALSLWVPAAHAERADRDKPVNIESDRLTADDAKKEAPAKVSGYSKKGADTCLGCHDDDPSLLGIFQNAHGSPTNARSPFGHGQLQCEACHGPGDLHAKGKGKNRPKPITFGKGSATPVEIKVLGDWAYLRNFIEITITPPGGAPVHRSGYTLTILRKEPDGKWVLARDANLVT